MLVILALIILCCELPAVAWRGLGGGTASTLVVAFAGPLAAYFAWAFGTQSLGEAEGSLMLMIGGAITCVTAPVVAFLSAQLLPADGER